MPGSVDRRRVRRRRVARRPRPRRGGRRRSRAAPANQGTSTGAGIAHASARGWRGWPAGPAASDEALRGGRRGRRTSELTTTRSAPAARPLSGRAAASRPRSWRRRSAADGPGARAGAATSAAPRGSPARPRGRRRGHRCRRPRPRSAGRTGTCRGRCRRHRRRSGRHRTRRRRSRRASTGRRRPTRGCRTRARRRAALLLGLDPLAERIGGVGEGALAGAGSSPGRCRGSTSRCLACVVELRVADAGDADAERALELAVVVEHRDGRGGLVGAGRSIGGGGGQGHAGAAEGERGADGEDGEAVAARAAALRACRFNLLSGQHRSNPCAWSESGG